MKWLYVFTNIKEITSRNTRNISQRYIYTLQRYVYMATLILAESLGISNVHHGEGRDVK